MYVVQKGQLRVIIDGAVYELGLSLLSVVHMVRTIYQ